MGLMQTEHIQVQAEAYDVAMDISFPRGTFPLHSLRLPAQRREHNYVYSAITDNQYIA